MNCINFKNPEVAALLQEYTEILGDENAAYYVIAENNGYGLDKTPNGADSELFKALLDGLNGNRAEAIKEKAKVYTKSFRDWFGDWISNDKTNVSKIVDQNDEPLIVYHGTDQYGFNIFDPNKSDDKISLFASSDKGIASTYTKFVSIANSTIRQKLIEGNAEKLIEWEQWNAVSKIINNIYGFNPLFNYYLDAEYYNHEEKELIDYIKNNNLSSEEIRTLFDELWDLRDKNYKKGAYTINKIGNTIKIYDNFQHGNSGFLVEEGIIFEGTKNQLIEALNIESKIYNLFLNIKNPIIVDNKNEFGNSLYWNNLQFETKDGKILNKTREVSKYAKENNYDGVVFKNISDRGAYPNKYSKLTDLDIYQMTVHQYEDSFGEANYSVSDVFISFNSNQIKSALYNEGTFYTENNNIYHSLGEINEDVVLQVSQLATRHSNGVWTTEDSEDKINSIFEAAKSNGYRVRLLNKWKSANIQPFILQYVGEGFSEKTSKKDKKAICVYLNYLKDVFPELNIKWVKQKEFFDKWVTKEHIHADSNSFVKNRTVYLIEGRVTAETAIEEFLHPLITSMQYDNTRVFDLLLEDALANYKSLVNDIQKRYKEFNQDDINNEIVTQALTKIVKNRYDTLSKEDRESAVKLFSWLITKLKNVGRKIVFNCIHFNEKITLNSLAEVITSEHAQIHLTNSSNNDIKYSLPHIRSNSEFYQQKASEEMLRLFSRMYNKYNKVSNKTKRQQKIQDKIYEKYSELKVTHDKEALRIGLTFAIERIGDIGHDGQVNDPNTLIGFFHNRMTSDEGFGSITAEQLYDMWDNSLAYLQELDKIVKIANLKDAEWADPELRKLAEMLSKDITAAIDYWKQALTLVTDKIIDDLIDRLYTIDSKERVEEAKKVAKDWLHKNSMYSDISTISKIFSNYSYSSNPVIKLAFQVIQEATYKANKQSIDKQNQILEYFNAAKPIGNDFRPGSWEKIFMEYDRLGNPTGNFVRPINYGQYNIDRCQFMEDLKEEFKTKYGFFYYDNEAGVTVRSNDQFIAENEEWEYDEYGKPVQPKYIEWLLRIEEWECKHANKRYTFDYYKERLSIPYNGDTDSNGNYNIYTSKGHGLSLKTLAKYNRIQSNINYYLDKCTGKDGFARPETLSKEDKIKLDDWKTQLEELSNPYTEDGELKPEDDIKCALEIQAWQNFIGEKTEKYIDRAAFDTEIRRIKDEANQEFIEKLGYVPVQGTQEYYNMELNSGFKLQEFLRYNAKRQIDPDYYTQTFGQFDRHKEMNDDAIRASYFKSALQKMMHQYDSFSKDLSVFRNNPQFFVDARQRDIIINRGTTTINSRNSEDSPSFYAMLSNNYITNAVLHIEREVGSDGIIRYYLIDRITKERYISSDANNHQPMSEYQYLMDKYTEMALADGVINGLNDYNGVPISFSGLNKEDIMQWLEDNLFTYEHQYYDENGQQQIKKTALSVFTQLQPAKDKFIAYDGTERKTIDYIPTGNRFAEIQGEYYNSQYDNSDTDGVQPKKEYYQNDDYYKMANDSKKKALYDQLISTMQEAMQIIQPNAGTYQYFLPQIEAKTESIITRCNLLNSGSRGNTWNYLMNAAFGMQQNDLEYIRLNSDVKNADGTSLYKIPIRFLNKLEDPSTITSHVTSAVLMFADMANLFKEKTQVFPQLNLLQNALAPQNRQYDRENSIYSENSKESWEAFNNMMKTHMFERIKDVKTGDELSAKRGWWNSVAVQKNTDRLKTTLQLRMLGFNLVAAATGGLDSFFKIFRNFMLMKHGTPRDLAVALTDIIRPDVLGNIIRSAGTPIPTCKLVALMQLNSMKHTFRDRIGSLNHGKLSYFTSLSTILMGAFSIFDYINTAIVLRGHYNHTRLYTGPYVDHGFYTRHELIAAFKNKGWSRWKAEKAYTLCRKTMWDAYDFKNGKLLIKPEYEQYLNDTNTTRIYTKTHLRSALYNGMQPENDRPYFQTQWWGKWAFSIRNWMLQFIQDWLPHGDDYNVINVEPEEEYKLKGNKFKRAVRYIAKNTKHAFDTDSKYTTNVSFNVATGEYNNQTVYELLRFAGNILRNFYYLCTFQFKKIKALDYITRYALANTVLSAACLYGQVMANSYFHNQLKYDTGAQPAPSGYITSTGERSSNILDFSPSMWIQSGDYQYTTNLLQSRLVGGTYDEMSPYAVYDLVKTAVAISSGAESFGKGIAGVTSNLAYQIAPELTSFAKDGSEIVKQGGYRGETEFAKNVAFLLSPLKNLHTTFAPNGASSTDQFYISQYKYLYDLTSNPIIKTNDVKKQLKYESNPELMEIEQIQQEIENSPEYQMIQQEINDIEQNLY